MKNLIQNIIANSPDSKMLRSEIFSYFSSNKDVSKREIRSSIKTLVSEGIIKVNEVPGEFYTVNEYELTEEYKSALNY